DARDVEQIVHEPYEVSDLALDCGNGRLRPSVIHRSAREDLACRADGREWIAQLVREHREEFVLESVFLKQAPLELFAPANVPHDLRGAHDFAFVILQGRDGERHLDPSPILREPYCVEVIDALTAPQLLQEALLLLVELGRDDRQDGFTDDLALGVPEESFRGRIPRGNPAVDALADDGIVGGFDDQGELSRPELQAT